MLIEEQNNEFSGRHMLGVLAVVAVLILTGIVQVTGFMPLGEVRAAQPAQASPDQGRATG